jgi:uncharacterized membrane protein YfcA
MQIVGLLIIGVVAGIMAGMFGIGGGVVIVPALIIFLNFTLLEANGTSLAALLLPVSIFAVISYHKSGFVKIRTAAYISAGILLGVSFGSTIALNLPSQLLKILYGCFLLYVGLNFSKGFQFLSKLLGIKSVIKLKTENEIIEPKFYVILLTGLFAGVMSGMFGIGGGLIIVPILMYFYKYPTKLATGTSLAALLLPVGLPGVIMYQNSGNLNILTAIPLAFGIVFGSIIGSNIAISLPPAKIKKFYGFFLIIMGLDFIFQNYLFI